MRNTPTSAIKHGEHGFAILSQRGDIMYDRQFIPKIVEMVNMTAGDRLTVGFDDGSWSIFRLERNHCTEIRSGVATRQVDRRPVLTARVTMPTAPNIPVVYQQLASGSGGDGGTVWSGLCAVFMLAVLAVVGYIALIVFLTFILPAIAPAYR